MSLDHYVTLGRSGLRVSPFCLGAMTFGREWGYGCEADEAKRILDRYIERGGNFVDTANLVVDGATLAAAVHRADRDASTRGFSRVPTY